MPPSLPNEQSLLQPANGGGQLDPSAKASSKKTNPSTNDGSRFSKKKKKKGIYLDPPLFFYHKLSTAARISSPTDDDTTTSRSPSRKHPYPDHPKEPRSCSHIGDAQGKSKSHHGSLRKETQIINKKKRSEITKC
jgi:hypothetical protein